MTGYLRSGGVGGSTRADSDGVVDVGTREPDVGTLDLLDLQLLNQRRGRDPLPYPFMLTRRGRFEFAHQVDAYAADLHDRMSTGDLSRFSRCLDTLENADITVVGHVQYIPASTPSIRLLACRAGQSGFLFSQQPDADVVDVSTVSPFEIGSAVAKAMALDRAGSHPRIIVTDLAPRQTASEDDDVTIYHVAPAAVPDRWVEARAIRAYAQVQSNWRPPRAWGIDSQKESLVWMRFDDGDYLRGQKHWEAAPVTEKDLAGRIECLVDADVEAWRDSMGEQ